MAAGSLPISVCGKTTPIFMPTPFKTAHPDNSESAPCNRRDCSRQGKKCARKRLYFKCPARSLPSKNEPQISAAEAWVRTADRIVFNGNNVLRKWMEIRFGGHILAGDWLTRYHGRPGPGTNRD